MASSLPWKRAIFFSSSLWISCVQVLDEARLPAAGLARKQSHPASGASPIPANVEATSRQVLMEVAAG
ncbi:hypothetical protein V5799_024621 [Amblyomma americanum]|uniref:Secreted protein n=1 Tax=Amblyomma americanum TaxID=6943 RepID=A0AAQ4EBH7_AMBAM